MSHLATPAFLDRLKSIYPSRSSNSSAYLFDFPKLLATHGHCAGNEPDAVPLIFQHALQCATNHEERLLVARKVRDAIFKSSPSGGFARGFNSLVALDKVMPEDLKDKELMRNPRSTSLAEYEAVGEKFFQGIYGDRAEAVQSLLDGIYPDIGYFSKTIGFGFIFGFTEILTSIETSYTVVATLIAIDTPKQIGWHLQGASRLGAKVEELKAVRQIAMEVAELCGVKWKEGVPEVQVPE
ncbi:hypothetical protein V5O48_016695 [Marasmius crinis-equi]|uniref:Carboxymuconolactone decarboxylase-like domain-containing protein n=1 Tax=Marasmius crinis-equi TaxID=585013 RepID=A0ABR3ER27_9AGAR